VDLVELVKQPPGGAHAVPSEPLLLREQLAALLIPHGRLMQRLYFSKRETSEDLRPRAVEFADIVCGERDCRRLFGNAE
jgi:hypothetical protein